jgi:hypothetical protein
LNSVLVRDKEFPHQRKIGDGKFSAKFFGQPPGKFLQQFCAMRGPLYRSKINGEETWFPGGNGGNRAEEKAFSAISVSSCGNVSGDSCEDRERAHAACRRAVGIAHAGAEFHRLASGEKNVNRLIGGGVTGGCTDGIDDANSSRR